MQQLNMKPGPELDALVGRAAGFTPSIIFRDGKAIERWPEFSGDLHQAMRAARKRYRTVAIIFGGASWIVVADEEQRSLERCRVRTEVSDPSLVGACIAV